MYQMFYNCTKLTRLDTTGWDLRRVSNMNYLFYNCSKLAEVVGMDDWNTAELDYLSYTFYNCDAFTALNVNHFDVDTVTSMAYAFYDCDGIVSIDLSSWISIVTNVDRMFYSCGKLHTINLMKLNVKNVTEATGMFNNCTALTTIYADNWTGYITPNNHNGMFSNCSQLVGAVAYNSSYTNWTYANQYTGYFTNPELATTENILKGGTVFNSAVPNTATAVYIGDYTSSIPESGTIDFSASNNGSVVGIALFNALCRTHSHACHCRNSYGNGLQHGGLEAPRSHLQNRRKRGNYHTYCNLYFDDFLQSYNRYFRGTYFDGLPLPSRDGGLCKRSSLDGSRLKNHSRRIGNLRAERTYVLRCHRQATGHRQQ